MTYQLILSEHERHVQYDRNEQKIRITIPFHLIGDLMPDTVDDVILVCHREEQHDG